MVSKSFWARALLLPLAAAATAQQPNSSIPPSSYPQQPAYQAPPANYPASQPAYPAPQPGYQSPPSGYPPQQASYPAPAGIYAPPPGAYRPTMQAPNSPAGYASVPAAPPPPAYQPPGNDYAPATAPQTTAVPPTWPQGAPGYPSAPQSPAPPQSYVQPASVVAASPSAQPLPNYTSPVGQSAVRQPELAIEPYHKHQDTHHGHDQVYPDRGALVRDLPRAASVINYAGSSYWFADGVWLEPRGPAFVVTSPPIGLVVPTLPTFSTAIVSAGRAYLYANDVYYRPRPDLGGYEVVNDPEEPTVESGGAFGAAGTSSAPGAIAVPAALTNPASLATLPATAPVATPAVASIGPPGGTGNSPYFSPRNGQTPDEQARDRYDCYRFAVTQTGFDPMRVSPGTPAGQYAERQAAYDRAQAACYEGRDYSGH